MSVHSTSQIFPLLLEGSNAIASYALYYRNINDIEKSYELGKLAVELLKKPETETTTTTVLEISVVADTILEYLIKKDCRKAILKAEEAKKYQQSAAGLVTNLIHIFYYSLALL